MVIRATIVNEGTCGDRGAYGDEGGGVLSVEGALGVRGD